MGINFDTLPTDRPSNVPAKGLYFADIIKTEMKAPFDKNGPDELILSLKLTTLKGESGGFLNDKIKEKGADAVMYKTGRLIHAANLDLKGDIELKDLGKILVGTKVLVDVGSFKKADKEYATVNLFEHKCYYKVAELNEALADAGVALAPEEPKTAAEKLDDMVEDAEY